MKVGNSDFFVKNSRWKDHILQSSLPIMEKHIINIKHKHMQMHKILL